MCHLVATRDVAKLFGYGTKDLNRNVKNNINRFPLNYCFQLTEDEYENLRCKIFTSSLKNNYGGRRYLPYVFTEYGITMLAGILKSNVAVEMSIRIVNAFVLMRKYLSSSNYEKRISNIETKLIDYDRKFDEVFDKLDPKINNHIFFEGQIYDTYSLLIDILSGAKEEIILIDNYVDKRFLDVISHIQKKVILITNNKCNLTKSDVQKYNSQYSNLEIRYISSFHDRFILIDNEILYHCDASLKDLGKKCFAITRIEDKCFLEKLQDNLK